MHCTGLVGIWGTSDRRRHYFPSPHSVALTPRPATSGAPGISTLGAAKGQSTWTFTTGSLCKAEREIHRHYHDQCSKYFSKLWIGDNVNRFGLLHDLKSLAQGGKQQQRCSGVESWEGAALLRGLRAAAAAALLRGLRGNVGAGASVELQQSLAGRPPVYRGVSCHKLAATKLDQQWTRDFVPGLDWPYSSLLLAPVMVTTMRLSWVLCLVMVHLPMDTRVSGEPGTQRRGEKNQN